MQPTDYLADLFAYIDMAPTAYHAVATSARQLSNHGFQRLHESELWGELSPGSYFVTRNDSSLVAFTLSPDSQSRPAMRMAGAHTDSPGLKLKPVPMQTRHGFLQLGVEVYGGPLLAPWFDRNLSIAGRIVWSVADGVLRSSLIDCRRPVAIIPSLAIHLDREANEKRSINKQTDLVPLVMLAESTDVQKFHDMLRQELVRNHVEAANAIIFATDLFLYDIQPVCRAGWNNEFISGPRLDNLLSCHVLISAITQAEIDQNRLIVLNDHEEVGSVSTTGAQGPFLKNILERLYPDPVIRQKVNSRSLFVSVDNAHGVHPNFASKHEPEHLPLFNKGPVIKTNANQRYATNALTSSLFQQFCAQADVPYQQFVMRNDMACGSTIGPLTAAEIGVPTVDVGVPQLAMHSIRETAGHLDGWYLFKALTTFFEAPDERLSLSETTT